MQNDSRDNSMARKRPRHEVSIEEEKEKNQKESRYTLNDIAHTVIIQHQLLFHGFFFRIFQIT